MAVVYGQVAWLEEAARGTAGKLKSHLAVQSCRFPIPEHVQVSVSVSVSDENQNPNKHQAWRGHALKQGGGISVLGLHGWRCLLASSEPQATPQIRSDGKGRQRVAQQVPMPPLLPKNRHHLAPLPFQISALQSLQWV